MIDPAKPPAKPLSVAKHYQPRDDELNPSIPPEMREMLQKFLNGAEVKPSENFPPEVNARLETAFGSAHENLKRLDRDAIHNAYRLMGVALDASSSRQRVIWMYKAGEQFSKAYAPAAACRSGCSHCCHVPVGVTEAEAKEIGLAIGRAPAKNPPRAEGGDGDYTKPCPFLKDNACSIYASRPMACRLLLNLDSDDLLCRLVPGSEIPVPYADNRQFRIGMANMWGASRISDIRDWFPPQD